MNRVGNYDAADNRLSNALRAPLAPGTPQAELDAANANLALQFVDLLESTAPASLAGLQEWVKQRRDNLLSEEERSLDMDEYLQVKANERQYPCSARNITCIRDTAVLSSSRCGVRSLDM